MGLINSNLSNLQKTEVNDILSKNAVLKTDVANKNTSLNSSTNWVSPNYLQTKGFLTKDLGDANYVKYGETSGTLFNSIYQTVGSYAMASDLANYQTVGSYAMASDLAKYSLSTHNHNDLYQTKGSYAMANDSSYVKVTGTSFKVGGNFSSYYPVVFDTIQAWDNNGKFSLSITRSNMHLDSDKKGSLNLQIEGHNSNWGHNSNYLNYQYNQYAATDKWVSFIPLFIGDIIQDPTSTQIVIYLKGNSTYSWAGIGISPVNLNTSGQNITLTVGNKQSYSVTTTPDPKFTGYKGNGNSLENKYSKDETVTQNKVMWCADGNTCNVPIGITGNTVIEFGRGVVGKEGAAGRIGYGTYDNGASLNIVGAGTSNGNRLVRIWDNLSVYGNAELWSINSGPITTWNADINVGGNDNLRLTGSGDNRIIQSYGNQPININPIGNATAINLGNSNNGTNVLGNLNVNGASFFKGGVSVHNPNNFQTHFPWSGDNKNYIRGDTELRGNLNNIGDIDVGGALKAGNMQFKVFELSGKFGAALPTGFIDLALPAGVVTSKVMMFFGMTKNAGDSIPWDYSADQNWIVNNFLKANNLLSYRNTGSSTVGRDFSVIFIVKP